MSQLNKECVSCHLIGFNPYSKKEFISQINKNKFNIIDLDIINNNILKEDILDKLFKQYEKLKENKNDKYKEVEKKMNLYWQNNFIDNVENNIKKNKINILIGLNSYRNKKINIDCTNKFIIKSNDDIKNIIKYNLENHSQEIINGDFPLEFINYDFLTKKRETMEITYKKNGYIEKTFDEMNSIIKLIDKNNNTNIWISLKEPYNIGSFIHPKDKLFGYNDINIALLESCNISNHKNINDIDNSLFKKLKTRRFVYLVESNTFIPENNDNKFFSQVPVKILQKQKIDNVYNHLKKDSITN
jgi:hypothetical protein